MNKRRVFIFIITLLLCGWPETRAVALASDPGLPLLVAYQPRSYVPEVDVDGPSLEQIRSDLRLLRSAGFRGLVSYSARGAMGKIPEIARSEGFDDKIMMGIWDPSSAEEFRNAVDQAPFVDGYCMGNEGLGIRYRAVDLERHMRLLREASGLPVTTSEPVVEYLQGEHSAWLLEHSDWLFPNVHPYWGQLLDPARAAQWIIAHHDYLHLLTTKALLIKEAGFPTAAGEGLDEDSQARFFEALEGAGLRFFCFEAFDQPWKSKPLASAAIEQHWGLFDKEGKPKKFAVSLMNEGN